MEAARIEAFYAALKRRPSSTRSDSDEGSVRTHTYTYTRMPHAPRYRLSALQFLPCPAAAAAHALTPPHPSSFLLLLAALQYHGAQAAADEASQVLTEEMFGKGGSSKAAQAPSGPPSAHGSNGSMKHEGSYRGGDDGSMRSHRSHQCAPAPHQPCSQRTHAATHACRSGRLTRFCRARRSGNTMDEEIDSAFAAMEGVSLADFDPSKLGMNVSKDSAGGLVVTVPPRSGARRGSNAPVTPPGENSRRGGNAYGDGSGHGGGDMSPSMRSGHSSVDNSRHGPTDLADMQAQLSRAQARAASGAGAMPAMPPSPTRAAAGNGSVSGGSRPPLPPPSVLSPAALAATQAAAAASAQRDRRSFVARLRDPETGALSNLRLFGGNVGASTAMTRSIGDAGAARCCIAEPEFCTLLVAPAQASACVLACVCARLQLL
jgi:hypothetical protein